jgi:hypothetical protein
MLTLILLLLKYSLKPDFLHDKASPYLFNLMFGAAIFCDVLFGLVTYSAGIVAGLIFLLELTAYALIFSVVVYVGGYVIDKLVKRNLKATAQTADQKYFASKIATAKAKFGDSRYILAIEKIYLSLPDTYWTGMLTETCDGKTASEKVDSFYISNIQDKDYDYDKHLDLQIDLLQKSKKTVPTPLISDGIKGMILTESIAALRCVEEGKWDISQFKGEAEILLDESTKSLEL